MLEEYDLCILGSGATGLGAARHAHRIQHDFVVLEQAPHAGGLAASFRDDAGFTWDCGVHLHFSHYELYDRMLDDVIPRDGWVRHARSTAAWMHGRFVPYPVQFHLHHLPPQPRWTCLSGLWDARERPRGKAATFRDWILQSFGPGLAQEFLIPYNEKIWRTPLEELSAKWVGERVAVPDLRDCLRRLCLGEDDRAWGPNAEFRYPLCGGSGEVWNRLAATLPPDRLRTNDAVRTIDADNRLITTVSGRRYRYHALISTIPLDDLLGRIISLKPLPSAARLKTTKTHLAGFGVAGAVPDELRDRIWAYYPEREQSFYRLTFLGNLSPHNVPDPQNSWSVLAEVAEGETTPPPHPVAKRVEHELRELGILPGPRKILSRWTRVLSKGYPIPTLDRDRVLADVLPRLEERHIYSRGRFGGWKYEVSNQDHSFMQGVEAVERIAHNHAELTLFSPNIVNNRRNVFPYPEWGRTCEKVKGVKK